MLNSQSERMHLAPGVHLEFQTPGPQRHFFGYYDKSPIDGDGRRLLCHRTDFDGRLVDDEDRAEVGFWDLETGEYHPLAETRAFNWQQGSMLQWLGPDSTRRVIFNDRREDRFVAVVLDLETGASRDLPTTLYSLDPKGRYAVTPSFERLAFCRPGYCYAGIRDERWHSDRPPGDGVFRMDLETGDTRRIVALEELLELQPLASMAAGEHFVEHMLVNPTGERFAFLHRWKMDDGGYYSRSLTCDAEGRDLYLFPDGGFYSHGHWQTERDFVIYGRPAGTFSKVRYSGGWLGATVKPVLRTFRGLAHRAVGRWAHRQLTPDGFLRITDQSGQRDVIAAPDLPRDGHMSFRPGDPSWMLVDSYPDPERRQHLMAYHVERQLCRPLGWFVTLADQQATGYRCDLHPRWSPCGNRVVIDSLHEGLRQIYVLDVRQALETES
ncbi:MAG: hypothetical protein AAF560_06600 [Acidobacteriota bacterium]